MRTEVLHQPMAWQSARRLLCPWLSQLCFKVFLGPKQLFFKVFVQAKFELQTALTNTLLSMIARTRALERANEL
jgi:hypothetical protein